MSAVDLRTSRPAAEYWERLEAGDVPFQRCAACGAAVYTPRVLCPVCGATELTWQASSGRGVVYSATTVHKRDGAYTVGLVDLEEGIRVLVRVDGAADDEPPIGRAVVVVAGEIDGEPALRSALVGVDGDA
jgi:uncharacterized OB-fold protein